MREAVQRINADFNRSADTHLIKVDLPGFPDQTLYLKDESTHPTGSLKHRLARSLYLFALCNGWIGPDTVIVESSSGSTAVSEAYFARLLGLRFIAVVQEGVSRSKIDQIAFYGGETRAVAPADIYAEAQRITAELGAITWTSSPMPSALPIGAATTTLPKACSRNWPWRPMPCRTGW